jgi:hypothetical protein
MYRVKDEMSTIWPITAKNEFADTEVTELFKIRHTPLNPSRGVNRAQYHALQMTTKPGEKEGTTIQKTVLLERLNPKWMGERFNPKLLRMVSVDSSLTHTTEAHNPAHNPSSILSRLTHLLKKSLS